MEKHESKTTLQDGSINMEKSLTKKMGDDYVKVTVGISLPIAEASADKIDYAETKRKINVGLTRISSVLDSKMDDEFEDL